MCRIDWILKETAREIEQLNYNFVWLNFVIKFVKEEESIKSEKYKFRCLNLNIPILMDQVLKYLNLNSSN